MPTDLFNIPSRHFVKLAKAGAWDESKHPRDKGGKFDEVSGGTEGGTERRSGWGRAAAIGGAAALGAGALAVRASPLYRGVAMVGTRGGTAGRALAAATGARYPTTFEQTLDTMLTGSKMENRAIRGLGRVGQGIDRYRDLFHGLRATGSGRLAAMMGAASRGSTIKPSARNMALQALGKPVGAYRRIGDRQAALRLLGAKNPRLEAWAREAGVSSHTLRRTGVISRTHQQFNQPSDRTLRQMGWVLRRLRRT